MTTRLLLDTDIGSDVDDALALGVLLSAPEVIDLVAVTTVAKIARRRADTAARLLGLAGRTDVEVHVGHDEAVLRPGRFVWREIEDANLPEAPDAPISDEPAVDRILRASREVEGLEILAIGSMTNLAHAVALDPELPGRVARLTIMGGHIRRVAIGDYECPPGIDYNLCSDPEAAVTVLGAGFPTRLVTADVTLQTWMRDQDLLRFEAAGPFARALGAMVRVWKPFQQRIFTGLGGTLDADNAAYLHDPLTALSLIDAAPLRFESLRILTAQERGTLRTHEVPSALGIGAEMEVATSVDAAAARDAIVERIASLPF